MNFQNLQYFLAVAEEMSITRAAERLHISEQALSHHISRLEKELNTQLFNRSPKFTLSLAGRRLQSAAEEIGAIRHQLQVELDDISNNTCGELRIGVSFTRGQAVLPLLLPPYHETHPNVTVTLLEGSSAELQMSLAKGLIDLFIGYAPINLDTAEVVQIGRERLFLVVPRHFMEELYGAEAENKRREFSKGVDIAPFAKLPFILLDRDDRVRRLADRLFARRGLKPNMLLETRNIQTAFALSMKGMGLTVYPELFLSSSSTVPAMLGGNPLRPVDCFPLKDESTVQTIVVAYDKERYLSFAARDFIREAQAILGR